MRAKYSAIRRRPTQGVADPRGIVRKNISTEAAFKFYAFSPTGSTGAVSVQDQTVTTSAQFLCPPGTDLKSGDLVVWGARSFTVRGNPLDYQSGPFRFRGGLAVNVEEVTSE